MTTQTHCDHDRPNGGVQRFEQALLDRTSVSTAGAGSAKVEPGDTGQDRAVPTPAAEAHRCSPRALGKQADPVRRLLLARVVAQVVVLACHEVLVAVDEV